MRCSFCKNNLLESEIHLSHDVPCYLFEGQFRKDKKPFADKLGRRYLCKPCHLHYERALRIVLQLKAKEFSTKYFEEEDDTRNNK